jgi:hypothetical protein
MKSFEDFRAVAEAYVQMNERRGTVVKFKLQGSRSEYGVLEDELMDFFNHSGIMPEDVTVDNQGNVTVELSSPSDAKEVKDFAEDEGMVKGSVKIS